MEKTMHFTSFGYSDIGPSRNNNEDLYIELPEKGYFALADGMGGHLAGEVAAEIAIQEIAEEFIQKINPQNSIKQTILNLRDAILHVNKKIYTYGRENRTHRGMGTTICCLYLLEDSAVFAHVGDSRIYRYRNNHLRKLTDDHSLVFELQSIGHLEKDEPISHPYKNIITKALGTSRRVEPEISSTTALPGDIFLLCSDGLSDFVSDEVILDAIKSSDSIEKTTQNLIEIAKQNKSNDNITVLMIKITDGKNLSR